MKTTRREQKSGGGSAITVGRRRRGIALLLVMISVVVCSILTAGFLASQGTSIGIARNERDAEKARGLAQSGIDMCSWLIRNRSDWRTGMSPGTWLNNYSVGDGSVTVTAAEVDGASSFATNTTKAVVLTSVGTYGSRTFTLTATMGPTGGGTVFRGGNFTNSQIVLGNNILTGSAFVDSYNSSAGSYNSTHGANAVFGNSYAGSGALSIFFLSDYNGSFVVSNNGNIANAVYASILLNGPSSISQESQPYTLGSVVVPNEAGLTYQGNMNHGGGSVTTSTPGTYDSMTLSGSGLNVSTMKIGASGIYHITGSVSLGSYSTLQVNDGVNAVIIVDGSVSMSSNSAITLAGAGTLTMYVSGSVTMSSTAAVNNSGNTANFTLLGTNSDSSIQLSNSTKLTGSIYAPAAAVQLQNTATMYGAVISNSLTLSDNTNFHYDQALTSKRIDNITGGSAPAGTADYAFKIVTAGH